MFNHVETIHTVFYFLSISKRVLDYPIALSEFLRLTSKQFSCR